MGLLVLRVTTRVNTGRDYTPLLGTGNTRPGLVWVMKTTYGSHRLPVRLWENKSPADTIASVECLRIATILLRMTDET